MTRQKKLLLAAGTIIACATITGLIIFLNPTPQPRDIPVSEPDTGTVEEAPATEETPVESENPTKGGTDGHDEEPFTASDETAIFLNARQAAEAYVNQPRDESKATRQTRLAQYFRTDSPAIKRKVPVVADGYSTGQISTLETNWYTLDETARIGVIVYLKVGVNTGFNAKDEYQTWIVKLKKGNNVWSAHDIEKSNLTYIPPEVN